MTLDTEDKKLIAGVVNALSKLTALVAVNPDKEKNEEKLFETIEFASNAAAEIIADSHGADADDIREDVKNRIDTELSLTVLKLITKSLTETLEDEE